MSDVPNGGRLRSDVQVRLRRTAWRPSRANRVGEGRRGNSYLLQPGHIGAVASPGLAVPPRPLQDLDEREVRWGVPRIFVQDLQITANGRINIAGPDGELGEGPRN